jgi:mono/diheme cytochrome c family protein
MGRLARCIALAWMSSLCALGACTSSGATSLDASDGSVEDGGPTHDVVKPLCERPRSDAVRDVFCADERPSIASLAELFALLELTPAQLLDVPTVETTVDDGASFVLLAHSTSLSGRHVSPINPRLIVLGDTVSAAFQRGVQRVELAARDRGDNALNFYLLSFEQACNASAQGCLPGDLYTPSIEQGWSALRIDDDETLKNTPEDCRQCHQRGPVAPRLLMRELRTPWTHFFLPIGINDELPSVDGSELARDYVAAKGQERYGGASIAALDATSLFRLENEAGAPQPLLFDAPRIVAERYPYSADGQYSSVAQPSPTWEAAYEAWKRGEQLALPYYDTRATDPNKQARLAAEYQRFLAGELSAQELPDLSDIFSDDPLERARIGLQTEPGASPQATLIQACAGCHNDVLDQSISRARFNVDLSRMDRAELDAAIARIELNREVPGAMPPPEARQIDPGSRAALLDYLRSSAPHASPDPGLQHAARLGMAGGAGP